jgi:hypothetical protein
MSPHGRMFPGRSVSGASCGEAASRCSMSGKICFERRCHRAFPAFWFEKRCICRCDILPHLKEGDSG